MLSLCCAAVFGQTPNFSSVDSLLDSNLTGVFHGKVICMVMHNDSLIYYYHKGGDSTSTTDIASATKTMSAALMLRLAQEKVVNLDTGIATYFPFAASLGKGTITLRQLFAHTSGLDGTTSFNANPFITLQRSADSILVVDSLKYTPIGSEFCYTGEDQQVAGAAAEIAAGIRWDSLFSLKIAQPLGLISTTFHLTTALNPRIAGGIQSSAADMMRFGRFILHNGKNRAGASVVDSSWMQEYWKDQTNRAVQKCSPNVYNPPHNNPYHADTIYYGFGDWLDIYNPTEQYQEQISADGAFGATIWINRCTQTVGVFLTFSPSVYLQTNPVEDKAMDIFRAAVPSTCYGQSSIEMRKAQSEPLASRTTAFFSRNMLNVSSENRFSSFSVYDIMGKRVLFADIDNRKSSFDCGRLPSGMYMLTLADKYNGAQVIKLVKQ